jgi:hypothetical protein
MDQTKHNKIKTCSVWLRGHRQKSNRHEVNWGILRNQQCWQALLQGSNFAALRVNCWKQDQIWSNRRWESYIRVMNEIPPSSRLFQRIIHPQTIFFQRSMALRDKLQGRKSSAVRSAGNGRATIFWQFQWYFKGDHMSSNWYMTDFWNDQVKWEVKWTQKVSYKVCCGRVLIYPCKLD